MQVVCDTIRAGVVVTPALNRVHVADHPDRPVQGWEEPRLRLLQGVPTRLEPGFSIKIK